MIQEKDFLYRVPVKTAPITTPKGQIRNPEILVDLEGGEFMHGNILDANSTNKLINQSVKEAVDNKIIEGGYVTKDLLEAETSARTNGDEDLSAKIKAEQTRAEGKEKEMSDKLAIVDGDSNTEGSFRKAIADVIAAAPEDLDTLKEIADKFAESDDLHIALNQAITEKADASALANEVTRATGAESNLQAAIDAKQDAGNYIPYDSTDTSSYDIDRTIKISGELGYTTLDNGHIGFYSNDNPCEIENNSDYVLFSKKIKVSDIITDATTDSSLNTVLSKKVDTEEFNSFTSSVSGQLDSFNGALSTFNGDLSTFGRQIALKQDKITVNNVDVTDIETADITKLRTIVKNLIDALNASGLIRITITVE